MATDRVPSSGDRAVATPWVRRGRSAGREERVQRGERLPIAALVLGKVDHRGPCQSSGSSASAAASASESFGVHVADAPMNGTGIVIWSGLRKRVTIAAPSLRSRRPGIVVGVAIANEDERHNVNGQDPSPADRPDVHAYPVACLVEPWHRSSDTPEREIPPKLFESMSGEGQVPGPRPA